MPDAQAAALNLAPDDALSVLEYWHDSAVQLMFVYSRSGGVLTQIGRGCIQQASPEVLRFDTPGGHLEILVGEAVFEFGVFAAFAVDALCVCLRNEDRLYLCAADEVDAKKRGREPPRGPQRCSLLS